MGFRRIGVLADEVIRRVQETRAVAGESACPVESDVIGEAVKGADKADAERKNAPAETGASVDCQRRNPARSACDRPVLHVVSGKRLSARPKASVPPLGADRRLLLESAHYSPSLPSSSA